MENQDFNFEKKKINLNGQQVVNLQPAIYATEIYITLLDKTLLDKTKR